MQTRTEEPSYRKADIIQVGRHTGSKTAFWKGSQTSKEVAKLNIGKQAS